jgi:hypothetical protein
VHGVGGINLRRDRQHDWQPYARHQRRVPFAGGRPVQAVGEYGGVPIDVGVFADAGVAWTSFDKPSFAGGNRDWVRSVGATVRFNAFGYIIGEVDYVRPLDRPERGWMWQFNFTPGF